MAVMTRKHYNLLMLTTCTKNGLNQSKKKKSGIYKTHFSRLKAYKKVLV